MKLATYRDGSRDGQLVVVSRDLATAHFASGIAGRLQQVLDDWNFLAPQLEDLSTTLNHGKARHAFAFDPAMCMAPLPRAHQRAQLAAWLPHVERVRAAADQPLPTHLRSEPLATLAPADDLWGPLDEVPDARPEDGPDFAAGLAFITGDIAAGAAPGEALEGVRLLMLACDWRLHARSAAELARGAGTWQGQLGASFSPVAVTPDELGDAWAGGRVQLTLQVALNGRKAGCWRRAATCTSTPASCSPTWRARAACAPAASWWPARSATRTPPAAGPAWPRNARWSRPSTARRARLGFNRATPCAST